jgi:hypothetical protein
MRASRVSPAYTGVPAKVLLQAGPGKDSRRATGARVTGLGVAPDNGRAQGMRQQYLAGELSLRLGQLRVVAKSQASVRDVGRLRQEAETRPPTALAPVVVRALELTDGLCWDSLTRGDTSTFTSQAGICADLREFGVCAGLLEED